MSVYVLYVQGKANASKATDSTAEKQGATKKDKKVCLKNKHHTDVQSGPCSLLPSVMFFHVFVYNRLFCFSQVFI